MNTGKLVKSSDEKLYHWNTQGGTTEWTLPKDWQNLASVKVYQLTDQGKTNEKTVAVSGGKISLTAEAETPYVVTKGSEKQISVKWSEGMHVVDAGFNGGQNTLKDNWAVSGTGKAEVEGTNNAMLRLTGDVKVSQKLTDLTAGKRYAIYVGVDNRTNSPAKITVTNGTKVLATNETGKSIAKNYIKAYGHNTYSNTEGGSSYFQNMYVWFVAPESGDVKVTLSHSGACDNTDHVYFDDVRVLENGYKGLTLNADGTLKTLTNDFEDNAQGIWPFVVSGSEGVEDNRIHLSELHDPFTQAGWDVKKMDDVLDGKWSVKANGLIQKGTLIYQTIPQNVKLEPGETYKVSFKYQSGSDDIYAIATGDGEYNASTVKLTNLKKALGEDGTAEFEITGSITGDSWFGIYSTSTAPDLQNTSDSAANFGGYKDFVLDDLKVEHVASAEHTKADAEAKLKEVKDTYDGKSGDYSAEVWTTYVNTVAEIEALIAKDKPDYTTAYNKAVALAEYMKNAPGDDSNDAYDVATDAYTVEAGSQQALSGGNEGPASLAQDGNAGTHWHTSWSANAVSAGTAWYQFNLNEPTTIDGLRYMARSGGANANGKIKKYKITLTLSDGTTKDVVTNGTFTTTSGVWQKVKFDAVKNVTKVRITALETAGQSAGEVNTYASAAELRVTWKVLVAKRDAAKKVLDDENATAHDVALAYQNLKDAIAALEERVDTSKLAGLVADAEKLKESAYTKDSWAAFKKALDAAKVVLNNANATKADVDAAYNALNAAMKALKPASSKPTPNPETTDKSKLQATIDQAKALDLSGYTKKSAQAVRDALAKAQSVLADDNATQADIDAAQKALADAIAALEKADANGNAISKTGANVAVIGMAGMMLVAAAGAVFIARKRAE